MGFTPRVMVMAWIGIVASCGAAGTPAALRVIPEAATVTQLSGIAEHERVVVRDRAQWREVWTELFQTQKPAPPLPEIDFQRSVVVVAAMGKKNTGGYTIHIDEAHLLGSGAVVSITESSPAGGCWVSEARTAPVAVVAMPWFAGKVEFLEHAERVDCKPVPQDATSHDLK